MRLVLMSVAYRTSGSEFYGLVTTKGPGRVNQSDPYRYERSAASNASTRHAGHGDYLQVINPGKTMDTRKPPPTLSKYSQRTVMYKPLVYNATTAVPGRAEILARNLRGIPVTRSPETIVSRKPAEEEEEMEDDNQVIRPVYAPGVVGSAPSGLQGAKYHHGQTVGDILADAAGKTATGAAAVSGIPVIGPVAAALGGVGAAGLEAAAGISNAIESGMEGDYSRAVTESLNAKTKLEKAGRYLNTIAEGERLNYGNSPLNGSGGNEYSPSRKSSSSGSYYTGSSGSLYDGSNFSSNFSGYQPGVTLRDGSERNGASASSGSSRSVSNFSASSSSSTQGQIREWLDEVDLPESAVGGSDYGSLEEFRSELDELITREEDVEMRRRLAALMARATRGTQTDFGVLSGAGASTQTYNPVVASAGASTQTGRARMVNSSTETMPSRTVDASTQVRNIPDVVAALEDEIDRLVESEGAAAQAIANNSVRWLNLLGLDTQAIENEINRKNFDIDKIQELIQEGIDTIRAPIQPMPREVRDMGTSTSLDMPAREGGVRNGTFVPPRENLITQANRQAKRKGGDLTSERSKKRFVRNDEDTQFGDSFINQEGDMPGGGKKFDKGDSGYMHTKPVRKYVDGGTSTQTPSTPLKRPNTRSRKKKSDEDKGMKK